ncbi:MAG: ABC transporter permease [Verrucomicrobia bacterium]|nr:ABC transporter permease [Verrucomicrobiota bacterium]
MNLWNIISTGYKEILAHKFRSFLSLLGIMLGVTSLVTMSAIIKGMENGMREGLIAIGGVRKFQVANEIALPIHQRHRTDQMAGLTLDDLRALQHNAPLLEVISPRVNMAGRGYRPRIIVTRRGKRVYPIIFNGTWPEVLEINNYEIEHGRMFNAIDDEMAQSVCVIGTGIRDSLFENPEKTGNVVNPLGEIIQINGIPFTIIGMFPHYASEEGARERLIRVRAAREREKEAGRAGRRKSEHPFFRQKNYTIYIPINTMLIKLKSGVGKNGEPDTRLSELDIKVSSVELLEPAVQQVRNVLSMMHDGLEDFSFRTQVGWANDLGVFIRNARVSGGIIAGIAMLVGGIGIMNIMLASISERIREIGIRKAVGATSLDVFIQILIESAVIAALGGVAGLVASYGLVHAISTLSPLDNTPIITVGAMVVAVGFSICVGVAAGLFPAFKASQLQPVQALRYD